MAPRVQRKAHYHHGELREALISATRQLVEQRGAENFTLADACRVAGVTTAAPYRHFRGKQEILEEIASRGFDELRTKSRAAVVAKGEGNPGGNHRDGSSLRWLRGRADGGLPTDVWSGARA